MANTTRFPWTGPKAAALLILTLAFLMRVWDLTSRSLWLDEAVEYWAATSPLRHLPAFVREIIQDPPLYSFLLHVWMLPSQHEAWMRLLSVVFGVGSVAGVMVIGYRLAGWLPALGAGLLMALMPTSIYYSQEVGQYAPMQCLIIWSTVALLDVVRSPDRARFLRWGLFAAAAMYMYYGTVLPVVIPFLCLIAAAFLERDRTRARNGLAALAAVFLAVLPLLIYFIPSQLHRGPTARGVDPGEVSSLTQGAEGFLKALKVTISFWCTGWPSTPISEWITIALFAVLLVFAVRNERRFAIWVGVTTLVYAVIGWLHVFPFGFRHSLILAPLFVPLLACALRGRNVPRIQRAAAVVVFTGLCVCAVLSPVNRDLRTRWFGKSMSLWPETEDVGPATKYWAEHRTPEQPTYVYYAAAPAFAYYAQRYTEQTSRPPDWFLHCWRNQDADFCRNGGVFYGRWLRALKPEEKAQSIFMTMDQVPQEFWFIMSHSKNAERNMIGAMLQQYFDIVDRYSGDDAAAILLRRNATPAESKAPATKP